jgi:hypothetical protein
VHNLYVNKINYLIITIELNRKVKEHFPFLLQQICIYDKVYSLVKEEMSVDWTKSSKEPIFS